MPNSGLNAGILPPSISNRTELALEVHARPPQAIETPARMTQVAVLVSPAAREAELAHLRALCATWQVSPPPAHASHFSAGVGEFRLRWERHGEFSSYTFSLSGLGPEAFSQPPIRNLPPGWLRGIPGETLYAAHAEVIKGNEELPSPEEVAGYFDERLPVGAVIGGGAGAAFTDFWIHADGFARFVMIDRSLTPRQAGRMLQRLFEIETYRILALLAFPLAKGLGAHLAKWEQALADLADNIARGTGSDESNMQLLTQLAADIESALARTETRCAASRAYYALITRRIAELREERIAGLQTIEEFMSRRLSPAIATISSTEGRLRALSERVGQVSGQLATRVAIAREAQNQFLLSALNRRAEIQFHLQRAIEGLSVSAIVYYGAGLVGYLAKAAKEIGIRLDVEVVVGVSIPIIALVSVWAVFRAHRRITNVARSDALNPDV
ncbi:MAG: DUF3422 domain-containing protein [Proteobacteria bacterium]|nr:DUF3422 domain-containing protein [Pseudomonadota bacterium]